MPGTKEHYSGETCKTTVNSAATGMFIMFSYFQLIKLVEEAQLINRRISNNIGYIIMNE